MPLSSYYGGSGAKVMREMKERYGKRGEEVFYATAKKKGQEPEDKPSRKRKGALKGLRKAHK